MSYIYDFDVIDFLILISFMLILYCLYRNTNNENFANLRNLKSKRIPLSTSYYKNRNASKLQMQPFYRLRQNFDFDGSEYKKVAGKSIDQCEELCGNDSICTHTTFLKNQCYLKTTKPTIQPIVMGLRRGNGTFRKHLNSSLIGFDAKGSGNKNNINECEQACKDNPECMSYSFNTKSNYCYIKEPAFIKDNRFMSIKNSLGDDVIYDCPPPKKDKLDLKDPKNKKNADSKAKTTKK